MKKVILLIILSLLLISCEKDNNQQATSTINIEDYIVPQEIQPEEYIIDSNEDISDNDNLFFEEIDKDIIFNDIRDDEILQLHLSGQLSLGYLLGEKAELISNKNISHLDFPLNAKRETIESKLGTPYYKDFYEGGYYISYIFPDSVAFFIDKSPYDEKTWNYEDEGIAFEIWYVFNDSKLTINDLIEIWGEPDLSRTFEEMNESYEESGYDQYRYYYYVDKKINGKNINFEIRIMEDVETQYITGIDLRNDPVFVERQLK